MESLHAEFARLAAVLDRARGGDDPRFRWQEIYARDMQFLLAQFRSMDADLKRMVQVDMERAASAAWADVAVSPGTPFRILAPDDLELKDPDDGTPRKWGTGSKVLIHGVPARVAGFVRYPDDRYIAVLKGGKHSDAVYQLPLEWMDALVAQNSSDGQASSK